jgi:hypothetical protein
MTMSYSFTDLGSCLQVLVGSPLSIARNALDMMIFHFGAISPHPSGTGTVGTYTLHIQCPWRLTAGSKVYTGTSDRFLGPAEATEVNDDPKSGNLQLVRMGALLKGYDGATKSFVNATDQLVVLEVNVDAFGGADLVLSGGYHLEIFPDGSLEEEWRFVEVQGRHVVVQAGEVRIDS